MLTPSLGRLIPALKSGPEWGAMSERCRAQARRFAVATPKELLGAGGDAGFAEAAEALDEQRGCGQGILTVDQVIEELVILTSRDIELFLYADLFSPGVTPPLALKIKDTDLKVAQGSRALEFQLFHRGNSTRESAKMWDLEGGQNYLYIGNRGPRIDYRKTENRFSFMR